MGDSHYTACMLVSQHLRQIHRFARFLAGGVVLIGVMVLYGWLNDIPVLYRFNTDLPVMPPNIAVAYIGIGIALYLLVNPLKFFSWQFYTVYLLVSLNFIISLSYLLAYTQLIAWQGLENFWLWLLPAGQVYLLTPAPQIALALALVSLGLFMMSLEKPYLIRWLHWAISLSLTIMVIVFFGYAHKEERFYIFADSISMSIYGATALALLGWGMILARVEQGDFYLMATDSLAGIMLRRVLLLVGIIPLILAWTPWLWQFSNFTHLQIESLLASMVMCVVLIFIVLLAHRLYVQESQYHAMEEDARRHQAEIAHMLRINTVGEMATNIAHELNQPLAAIANYAGACQRLIKNGAEATDLVAPLESMQKQTLRASEIVRRLRSFIAKPKPSKAQINLNSLITDVLAIMQDSLTKSQVELQLDLDYSLPAITVETLQIKQVIVNIVQNAIDALQVAAIPAKQLVISSKWVPQGCLQVDIEDNGLGIPADIQARIFEAFFTTKLAEHMGMGLSLSRSIIESHGGHLWVKSNLKNSTIFSFTLPTDPIVVSRTFSTDN